MSKGKEVQVPTRHCDTCKKPFDRRINEKVADYQARGTCGKPECIRAYQRKAALLRLGLIKKDDGEFRRLMVWDDEVVPKTKREFPKEAHYEDDQRAIRDCGTPRYLMPAPGLGPLTASSAHAATEGVGMSVTSKRSGLGVR